MVPSTWLVIAIRLLQGTHILEATRIRKGTRVLEATRIRKEETRASASVSCAKGLSPNDWGGCAAEGSDVDFDEDGTVNLPTVFMTQIAEGVDEAAQELLLKHMRGNRSDLGGEELAPEERAALQAIKFLKEVGGIAVGYLISNFLPQSVSGAMASADAIMVGAAQVVLPVLALPQGLLTYVQHQRDWTAKWEKTADIAVHLVQKTACLNERVVIRETDFLSGGKAKRGILKEELEKVCSADAKTKLLQQMVRSTGAMLTMFDEVASIGKCLYPIGELKDAKMSCIELALPKLRASNGKMGLLFSAITLASSFTENSDAMLAKERFGRLVENVWKSRPLTAESQDLVPKLLAVGKAGENQKPMACATLLGVQKAYEKTFAHLKEALGIWMQTFGRDLYQVSFTIHPCRPAVLELHAAGSSKGFCKHRDFPPLGSSGQCNTAMNTNVWLEKTTEEKEKDARLVTDALGF